MNEEIKNLIEEFSDNLKSCSNDTAICGWACQMLDKSFLAGQKSREEEIRKAIAQEEEFRKTDDSVAHRYAISILRTLL